MIVEGIVAFCDLTETERYNGQDTGKYSLVITMEDDEAQALKESGVIVREYKNKAQRKFVTKYPDFPVLDVEDNIVSKHIPYGSKVKILWAEGNPHPTYGVATYIKKIKVLEYAEMSSGSSEDEEDF
tara:strand:- start:372 stop:752 length:381 start_codon:yes stop_codon:yes gene_type:complete